MTGLALRRLLALVAAVLLPLTGAGAAAAAVTGPDVSRWQHINGVPINWSAVRASGQAFTFIQATHGLNNPNIYFAADWRDSRAVGLVRAPYHYALPDASPTSAVDQARQFIAMTGTTREVGDLAPTLDLEEDNGLSAEGLIRWAQTFLLTVEQLTGRTPIIYSYRYFWQTKMANTSVFSGYPLWIAQYSGTAPSYPLVGGWDHHTFWQYTSTGSLPGISGIVDISQFAGDLSALAAMADGTVTPIQSHWISLGGASSYLGAVAGPEYAVPGGRAQDFAGGTVYWSPATGATAVHGSIAERYRSLGGPASFLGLPTNDEIAVPGGRMSAFAGGQLYWSTSTGAHEIHGALLEHYLALGGPSSGLGLPTTDETGVTGVAGARRSQLSGATLLWSPSTKAQAVHGAIRDRYEALSGPAGMLGLPTTDEYAVNGGRAQTFTGGRVFWSAGTGAHEMHGALLARYLAVGGPWSGLGLPRTDETDVPGVPDARENRLTGALLIWSPPTAAHEVHGAILDRYVGLDGPVSALGLPTSDEYAAPDGRAGDFQHGVIDWAAMTGLTTVRML
ncbi:MAG: hypothetical protein M3Z02_11145 [Actinomycetota bacterium]|nr:hypothetical protein [Actinomycetota bacterium]